MYVQTDLIFILKFSFKGIPKLIQLQNKYSVTVYLPIKLPSTKTKRSREESGLGISNECEQIP